MRWCVNQTPSINPRECVAGKGSSPSRKPRSIATHALSFALFCSEDSSLCVWAHLCEFQLPLQKPRTFAFLSRNHVPVFSDCSCRTFCVCLVLSAPTYPHTHTRIHTHELLGFNIRLFFCARFFPFFPQLAGCARVCVKKRSPQYCAQEQPLNRAAHSEPPFGVEQGYTHTHARALRSRTFPWAGGSGGSRFFLPPRDC